MTDRPDVDTLVCCECGEGWPSGMSGASSCLQHPGRSRHFPGCPDRPDVDALVEKVRKRGLARNTHMVGSDQDWRGHFIISEAELSDLAALARRVAELEAALRLVPLDEWQEHANWDLLDLIESDQMHTFLTAARAALAGDGGDA
jgi:hypothetical protein